MEDEEYELTPRHKIEELKQEIDRLKETPVASTRSSKDLLTAMDNLSAAIKELMALFKTAGQSMKEEEPADKPDASLSRKIDSLLDQNRKIAEGLVSVVEMLRKEKRELPRQMAEAAKPFVPPSIQPLAERQRPLTPEQFMPQQPQPMMPPFQRQAMMDVPMPPPMPAFGPLPPPSDLPPIPPQPSKRKGMFGR